LTPKELRQLSKGFYGIGCQNIGVECYIVQVNKLLMHYCCPSSLGRLMLISLNLMILEMGISTQPLLESYTQYGSWITSSWLKSMWEKCNKYDDMVEFNNVTIALPRLEGEWLMRLLIRLRYSCQELEQLNRVRISFQFLFIGYIGGIMQAA